ncbi:MAG TPA: DUF29 family protein [Acetobacteraceae bacterium]|nr:DUF29 family protein [Acetobacteraceae bacterium]
MSEDLYTQDVVLWSERQADALWRMRSGERVNDLDWDNLIEEVGGLRVGRKPKAVRTLLVRALEHVLKAAAWPHAADAPAWRHESGVFCATPGRTGRPMDRHLDVHRIYDQARRNVLGLAYREGSPIPTPELCPLSLPDLLPQDEAAATHTAALAARLRGG